MKGIITMIIIPGHLEIITCEEWGAKQPLHAVEVREYSAPGFVFHHTAGQNYPPNSIPATQRRLGTILAKSIQHSHMVDNGWIDSGHHFLNTVDGLLFEGRHRSIECAKAGKVVIGAHAADPSALPKPLWFNDYFSVENEGMFDTHEMNPNQMQSLINLMAWVSLRQGFDSSRIEGHRATGISTRCPGDWLFGQTGAIRKAVHEKKKEFIKLGITKP